MLHRPKFDPSARYQAVRSMALGGRELNPGDEITGANPRLMARLYALRRIAPGVHRSSEEVASPASEKQKAKKEKPDGR